MAATETAASAIDMEQNPVTGFLESVGFDSRGAIIHVTDLEGMGPNITYTVSSGSGSHPRLSISENGDTSVIWFDAAGDVRYRKQEVYTQDWSPALTVSSDAVASTPPAVVAAGDTAWVVYEVEEEDGDRTIEETQIIDSAEPFLKSTVEVIQGSEEANLRVLHESGTVWTTWHDGPTLVGWSEKDPVGWSVGQTMTCDPADPGPTYAAIEDLVLAP